MSVLAELIVLADSGEGYGVERAIFDTIEPDAMARGIETFVARHLGPVANALFYKAGVGVVAGLALVDGSRVVLKIHRWNVTPGRLTAVQQLQDHQARAGLPAPHPLVGPLPLGHGLATVEELIDGRSADARVVSVRRTIARGLYDFIRAADDFDRTADLGRALILRSSEDPLWPEPHDVRFDFGATVVGAEWIDELARSARRRLQAPGDTWTAGHFDWRVENLGIVDGVVVAIYDWDSVGAAPEAVIVGNAAAQFSADWASGDPDPLPTLAEMQAFIDDYAEARGASFSDRERDVLDAANLAACTYGARCQHAYRTLHPGLGDPADTHWMRLLRQRGERWFVD